MKYLTHDPKSEIAARLFLSALARVIDGLDAPDGEYPHPKVFLLRLDLAIALALEDEDSSSHLRELVARFRRTIDDAREDFELFRRPPS